MSLNDKLADYFTDHPHVWIASDALAKIAGRCAWRTRVSNLRRERGMTIENRQKRIPKHQPQCPAWLAWDIPQACNCGGQYDVFIKSEYRYVPAPVTTKKEQGHNLNDGFQLR